MSELIQRLKDTATERGVTFNRIERECGLGNGTIKRWGEQSPRLDRLVVVAQFLEVSLDYLVFGTLRTESAPNGELSSDLEDVKREQGLVCDGSPLDEMEADLVAMFRLLPEEEREDIFDIVHLKYKRRVEKKKESIYWTYFDGSADDESGPAGGREARDGTA